MDLVGGRRVVRSLPLANIIPLDANSSFLALDLGRGTSDLELAVIDRLEDRSVDARERKALQTLRSRLRIWRHDRTLRFHSRAIIVVERLLRDTRPATLARARVRKAVKQSSMYTPAD